MKKKTPAIIAGVLALALVCGGGYLYVQNENAKAAEQILQQEQAAAEKAEADRLAAEQAAAEKAEADRLAAEQAAAEKAEADRLAAEQTPKPADNSSGNGKPDLNLSEGAHIPQTGDQGPVEDENGNVVVDDIPQIDGDPWGGEHGGIGAGNDMTWEEIREGKAPNVY